METAFERLLITYNSWMTASTIAAAVGALGGCLAVLIFDNEIRQNKKHLAIELFLGAITLGGVFGGYVSGKKLFEISELRQQTVDRDIARANAEAAHANAQAAAARNESAISLRQAEDANDRASKNEAESARLRKAAEAERLARLQLEQSTAGRRLETADQIDLADKLKGFSGQRAWIFYRDEDREALQFAAYIQQTLSLARWLSSQPQPTAKILTTGPPLPVQLRVGVWLDYTTDKASLNAAQALAKELAAKGFEVHGQMASSLNDLRNAPLVLITVEPRPAGVQGEIRGSPLSTNASGGAF